MMIQPEPAEEQSGEIETGVGNKDIKALEQALSEEKEKAEGYLANWQRAQADFVNYKRRSEQEKEETSKFAGSALMLSLIPILGDLERAFTAIPPDLAKLNWVDGIRLIERKLRASLEAQGLSAIEAVGEPFDPRLHEAVRQDKGKEGMVIEEVEKGYRLHDRVIRPSRVVVGNGEVEAERENNREN
ncbi:MAG: nucleotide exchange factor GrpE [Chloroflexi bacterium]|nr:nucleotide exchange factor GrpE [Chloroflexota bacterium]MBI3931255.1 nucleotide exchange factor GrpE [Chloroflexota bacterium]